MTDVPQYSKLFTCLYDEQRPVGTLGRGTHYSVFRAVEWLDVTRRTLPIPQIHDFAVIWDEDHDERVIEALERIYMAGLLSPIQFIGERKGALTAIVAARFYWAGSDADGTAYRQALEAITRDLPDSWSSDVGSFDRSPGSLQNDYEGIIADSEHKVGLYLANIDSLWGLGTRDYRPTRPPMDWADVPPPPARAPGQMPPPPPSPAIKGFPPGGVLPPLPPLLSKPPQ